MARYRIVKDASRWQDMDGETPVVQKINSYITCAFILSQDMPADECLSEARVIVNKFKLHEATVDWVTDYLGSQFSDANALIKRRPTQSAEEVVKILQSN